MVAVSVILPTYNRPNLTRRAVDSVLNQSFQDFELLLIDDGSQPALECYARRYSSDRIIQLRIDHGGVSRARNYGIERAKGKYIAFLDSDDEWHPEKLSRQVQALERAPDSGVCHTEEVWIRNGRRVNPRRVHAKASGVCFDRCVELCCISPSAAMIPKFVFDAVGLFDEAMRVCEDYEYWLRLTQRYRVLLLEEPLVTKYGGHQDQLSREQVAMDRFRVYALCKRLLDRSLTQEQRESVVGGIESRLNVLSSGARKRKRHEAVALYETVANAIGEPTQLPWSKMESELLASLITERAS